MGGATIVAKAATLTTTAGILVLPGNATLTNLGTVVVAVGAMSVGDGALVDNQAAMSMADGTQVVPYSTSGRLVNEPGATLVKSSGTASALITAAFDNAGTVQVPLGSLIVTNYSQTSTGKLSITLDGPGPRTQFGQLQVTGAASLGGTLSLINATGFTPPSGSTYAVVSYASHTGSVAKVNGTYTVTYEPADVLARAN